ERAAIIAGDGVQALVAAPPRPAAACQRSAADHAGLRARIRADVRPERAGRALCERQALAFIDACIHTPADRRAVGNQPGNGRSAAVLLDLDQAFSRAGRALELGELMTGHILATHQLAGALPVVAAR